MGQRKLNREDYDNKIDTDLYICRMDSRLWSVQLRLQDPFSAVIVLVRRKGSNTCESVPNELLSTSGRGVARRFLGAASQHDYVRCNELLAHLFDAHQ